MATTPLYRNSRELIRLAYYDRLTGCYNLERFQQACTDTLSHGSGYSIVVLNIRRFQYINEIFGAQPGRPPCLCDIADILQDSPATRTSAAAATWAISFIC